MKIIKQIKIFIKSIIQSFGFTIKGYHYIYLFKTKQQNNLIIEIIGLGGKTTLLKKILKSPINLNKIKPTYLEESIKFGDFEILTLDKSLMNNLLNEAMNSYNGYYRTIRMIEKIIIQDKYRLKGSIITDEGLIKENLELLILILEQENLDLSELFKNYRFIVLLPNLEEVIDRYFKRNKTPDHKKVEFREYIIRQYKLTQKFISLLGPDSQKYVLVNDNDKLSTNKVLCFLNKL